MCVYISEDKEAEDAAAEVETATSIDAAISIPSRPSSSSAGNFILFVCLNLISGHEIDVICFFDFLLVSGVRVLDNKGLIFYVKMFGHHSLSICLG